MTAEEIKSVSEDRPTVDIIILSWGRVPDTCAAVDSALSQKGILPHVILIDQGTAAIELEVLKAHVANDPRVTLICNTENKGVPGGRNQGSALGSAPYVVSLDNDAEFASENELHNAVNIMNEDSSIAVLAFRILLFSEDKDDASSWPYPLSMSSTSTSSFATSRFVGAGHMIRRRDFDAVGGYDDNLFFLHEEVDLAYRLMNLGQILLYSPNVVIRHKVSAENRVSWSGKRYYFHVRNTIYMAFKFNFSPASSAFNSAIAIYKGFKGGFAKGTFQGVLAGVLLIPKALGQRWKDKRVRLSDETRARIRACSATKDMSFEQKLRHRIGLAKSS